ncbi:hypothetical protein D3C78_709840 [compost metagenome]
MAEAVHQAPALQACQPFALFRQEAALAGLQPALAVLFADADVAVFRRDIDIAHHHQRLARLELALQQHLQVGVEAFLGRKLHRMIAALALGEITVHHGHRIALGIGEGAVDEAALGVLAVAGEALDQRQRLLAREQGHAIVAFLPVIVDVVAELADFRFRELVVGNLGFLQADHVRLVLFDQRLELVGTRPQAIDIERNDLHR